MKKLIMFAVVLSACATTSKKEVSLYEKSVRLDAEQQIVTQQMREEVIRLQAEDKAMDRKIKDLCRQFKYYSRQLCGLDECPGRPLPEICKEAKYQ